MKTERVDNKIRSMLNLKKVIIHFFLLWFAKDTSIRSEHLDRMFTVNSLPHFNIAK